MNPDYATGFCADSALEGHGFEPSVPRKRNTSLWVPPFHPRNSPSATKTDFFATGTDGSNPSPSTGESAANFLDEGTEKKAAGIFTSPLRRRRRHRAATVSQTRCRRSVPGYTRRERHRPRPTADGGGP